MADRTRKAAASGRFGNGHIVMIRAFTLLILYVKYLLGRECPTSEGSHHRLAGFENHPQQMAAFGPCFTGPQSGFGFNPDKPARRSTGSTTGSAWIPSHIG